MVRDATDFTGFWSGVIESIETGVQGHKSRVGEPVVGGTDPSKLTYPTTHILPNASNYESGHEHRDNYIINFYFERPTDGGQDLVTNVKSVETVLDDILSELESNTDVGSHRIDRLEFFEDNAKLIDIVQMELLVTKLVDYSTTGE